MKKTLASCLILVSAFCLLLSCGYRFSPGGEHIDPGVRKIYVDNLFNNTSEANVENIFRSALIERFQATSRFKLADNRDQADAILKGGITKLYTNHLSYSSTDVAREDRAYATLDLTFETSGKVVIWSNHSYSWYADYLLEQGNPAITDLNRRTAIQKLATDMAERVYRAVMSDF